MRLHELDIKDHQLDELSIGKTVGKAAGNVAKGVGAVAGGIAGLGTAFKKGWQAGKATTSLDDQPGQQNNQGSTGQGSGSAASGAASGAAGGAAGGQGSGGGTEDNDVSALRDRILKLDDASRQDIIKALQTHINPPPIPKGSYNKDNRNYGLGVDSGTGTFIYPGQKFDTGTGDPIVQPGEKQPAATQDRNAGQPQTGSTKDNPNAPTFTGVPEKPAPTPDQSTDQSSSKLAPGAFGKMAQDLTKPLAGADSETPGAALPQKPGGNRPQGGGKIAGQLSTDPRAVKRREQRAAKKAAGKPLSQAELDAERERIMGPTSDSVIRKQPSITESFSFFRKH